MEQTEPFPITTFECVRNPKPIDFAELDFDEFVSIMSSFSTDRYTSKEDAPLFSPTRFTNNRRAKANATVCGLIVLDIDDGQSIPDTLDIVEALEVAALIYSTASHRSNHHKLRLCIPLSVPVDYDVQVACWKAINHVFTGDKSDCSKVGCESLFYVPGNYSGAPQVFESRGGQILSASEWIEIADLPPDEKEHVGPSGSLRGGKAFGATSQRSASAYDLDIYDTKLITEAALEKYQSSVGQWHHARFGLMLHIAGRAIQMGIAITSNDIVHLFNQVDCIDGSHYQTPKYQREIANDAEKALEQAS